MITLPGRRHRRPTTGAPAGATSNTTIAATGAAGLCQVAEYLDGVLVGIGRPCTPDTAQRVRDIAQETLPPADRREYRVVPAVIATQEARSDLQPEYRVAQLRDGQLIGLGCRTSLAGAVAVRDYCAEHPTAEYPQDVYRVVAA